MGAILNLSRFGRAHPGFSVIQRKQRWTWRKLCLSLVWEKGDKMEVEGTDEKIWRGWRIRRVGQSGKEGIPELGTYQTKSNTYKMQDARGLSIVKWVRNFEGGVIESGLWFWSIMTEAEGRLVFATFGKCLVIDLIDCSSLILKHVE